MHRLDRLFSWLPIVGSRLRRLRAAEATLGKINPGHFYSVVPSPEEIQAELGQVEELREDSLPGIPLHTASQLSLLESLTPYRWVSHRKSASLSDDPSQAACHHLRRYHPDNTWFQETDAALLYALIRNLRPRRIIEVGAGYSTLVMLDALDADGLAEPQPRVIEPYPERLQAAWLPEDKLRIQLIEQPLQAVATSVFTELEHGDVLFVDSSHVSKAGSDVNRLVFELLPKLQSGVWVHLHDIFFPFRYPKEWLDRGQYWNEAYLLRAFLMFNQQYAIKLWVDYLRQDHGSALAPFSSGRYQDITGSLWLCRC